MQSSSEVWVVYRYEGGGIDDWRGVREVIVAEHSSEMSAREYARSLDWGKDIGSTNWHHVRKSTRHVFYS